MKILFVVQGEGRGHMTQAIALHDILSRKGHSVCAVLMGSSNRRTVPDYFSKQVHCPIHLVQSPNFVTDKDDKGIRLWKTIYQNFLNTKTFINSLDQIHQLVVTHQPDIILNFYDLLGGIYNYFYKPKAKFIAIGHQYLAFHPCFPFAKGSMIQKQLFILNTKITALGADKMIALSFWDCPQEAGSKVLVWPPLLRGKIKDLKTKSDPFYLIYIVNSGYGQEILEMARKNKKIHIEVFWDHKEMPVKYQPLPNLIFHRVNDQLFLEKMAACHGLLTTAGFESVCEAMYLGKKVLMVPVKGQYEQKCNAIDAVGAGAGITADHFNVIQLRDHISRQNPAIETNEFKKWQHNLENLVEDFLGQSEEKEPMEKFLPELNVN